MASTNVNLTVAECVRLGYFEENVRYEDETIPSYTLIRPFHYPINRIMDFLIISQEQIMVVIAL